MKRLTRRHDSLAQAELSSARVSHEAELHVLQLLLCKLVQLSPDFHCSIEDWQQRMVSRAVDALGTLVHDSGEGDQRYHQLLVFGDGHGLARIGNRARASDDEAIPSKLFVRVNNTSNVRGNLGMRRTFPRRKGSRTESVVGRRLLVFARAACTRFCEGPRRRPS